MDEYESLNHTRWECKYHCMRRTAYRDICSPILYGLDSHVRPPRSSLSCGLAAHDWELRRWTTAVNVELLAAPRRSRGISYVSLDS